MADLSRSWCPICRKWVPSDLMNYDQDDEGNLIRVCTPCLDEESDKNNYVLDPHHEEIECIYCGSYNTVELRPKWTWFQCNDCNAKFRRM